MIVRRFGWDIDRIAPKSNAHRYDYYFSIVHLIRRHQKSWPFGNEVFVRSQYIFVQINSFQSHAVIVQKFDYIKYALGEERKPQMNHASGYYATSLYIFDFHSHPLKWANKLEILGIKIQTIDTISSYFTLGLTFHFIKFD